MGKGRHNEGKISQFSSSWQLIQMLEYRGADQRKYICKPSKNNRKRLISHQKQISTTLALPNPGQSPSGWARARGQFQAPADPAPFCTNTPETLGGGGAWFDHQSRAGAVTGRHFPRLPPLTLSVTHSTASTPLRPGLQNTAFHLKPQKHTSQTGGGPPSYR